VAGGPSVIDQPLDLLRGHRVIAINSSWSRVPFADLLFFGDARWFYHNGDDVMSGFAGRIATCALGVGGSRVLRLRRAPPPGLAAEADTVTLRRTSATAAINLAVHLGVSRIVLLGLDGKVATDGRTHHHAPHPWHLRHGWADEQRDDLASLVAPLQARKVEVLNAAPDSAVTLWPAIAFPAVIGSQSGAASSGNIPAVA